MRKIFTFSIFLLFILLSTSTALSQETDWIIDNFTSHIQIHNDTSMSVTESITVDFYENKHGIFRTIPINYTDRFGNNYNIRLSQIEVLEDGIKPETNEYTEENGNITIKVGSKSSTKKGPHTYEFTYVVQRAITTPEDYAELYWNVTGHNWPVAINNATATISGPDESILDVACYTGEQFSTDTECMISNERGIATFNSGDLAPGDNLTVSVKLDPSQLSFPTTTQNLLWFLEDNWEYTLPFLTLIFMYYLYWNRGRDRIYKDIFHEVDSRTIVKPLFHRFSLPLTYGPPKDLRPGIVGTIADERVQIRDMTATMIDLARRGFISIEEKKKGIFKKSTFTLTYTKMSEENLLDYEKKLLDTFFGTKRNHSPSSLDKLHSSSYTHYDSAISSLYKQVVDNGYFVKDPKSTRALYFIIGIIVLIFGFSRFSNGSINPAVPIILSGIVIIPFSFVMPARTAKGSRALRDITGLREWIRIGAWRERVHEKHNLIEEVLPYTIAFGLTYKFIKALKDSELKSLAWYKSDTPLTINSFSNSMSSIGHKATNSINTTRPKSSSSGGSSFSGGGGFSGGGFGGGGGGSW